MKRNALARECYHEIQHAPLKWERNHVNELGTGETLGKRSVTLFPCVLCRVSEQKARDLPVALFAL